MYIYHTEASHSSQQSSEAVSGDTTLSKDTATCSSKKTIINPQYLPSGPLINLTKVAAAQHRKVSYTSLVAKHAAAKGKRKTTPKTTPTTQPKPTFSIIRRKEIALTGIRVSTFCVHFVLHRALFAHPTLRRTFYAV